MAVVKRKKLYFTVNMAVSATVGTIRTRDFICTQLTPGFSTGDRYGALLQDFASATPGTPVEARRKRAVSAWFQCASESQQSGTNEVGALITQLVFMGGANADSNVQVPDAAGVAEGVDPIFTRHFRVRLLVTKAITDASVTGLRGTVYVQRQHSIEV